MQTTSVKYISFPKHSNVSNIFQNDDYRPARLATNVRDNIVYWTAMDENGQPAIFRSPLKVTSKRLPDIFVDAKMTILHSLYMLKNIFVEGLLLVRFDSDYVRV